jgi:hypothetical protein
MTAVAKQKTAVATRPASAGESATRYRAAAGTAGSAVAD